MHVSLQFEAQPGNVGSYIHTALPTALRQVDLVMAESAPMTDTRLEVSTRRILKIAWAATRKLKGHGPFEQLRPD